MTEREAVYRAVGFVWGAMAGALVGLGALVVALALCAAFAKGAPVPKGVPAALPAEALHGTFGFHWGTMRGEIAFLPDGTYAAHLNGVGYCGEWSFDGARVTLWESLLRPDGVPCEYRNRYVFTLNADGTGASGGTAVKLVR